MHRSACAAAAIDMEKTEPESWQHHAAAHNDRRIKLLERHTEPYRALREGHATLGAFTQPHAPKWTESKY
eukprot:6206828-Pleurochrysis_carterae.AAC.2